MILVVYSGVSSRSCSLRTLLTRPFETPKLPSSSWVMTFLATRNRKSVRCSMSLPSRFMLGEVIRARRTSSAAALPLEIAYSMMARLFPMEEEDLRSSCHSAVRHGVRVQRGSRGASLPTTLASLRCLRIVPRWKAMSSTSVQWKKAGGLGFLVSCRRISRCRPRQKKSRKPLEITSVTSWYIFVAVSPGDEFPTMRSPIVTHRIASICSSMTW
mmetsp:Transcript_57769/g.151930  ORF Transcript_57769/g.151930 Transcript_57769/m.151930 type:complete len:214 (+) Transcript_57769:231-872(+)